MVSFLLISFALNLKKFALSKALRLTLVMLPTALFFGGMYLQSGSPVITVTAGIYHNPANHLESRIFEALTESVVDTHFINFSAYDTLDALIEDVRLGRIDSGYIFGPNIENARRGEFDGIITLVTSPRTVAAPITNEIVASAVLRANAEDITRDGLEAFFSGNADIEAFVAGQFEYYTDSDIFMTPDFTDQPGQAAHDPPNAVQLTASRVFHGIIGLTLLTLTLFAIPSFIEERSSGILSALSAYGKLGVYYVSLWAAFFAVMLAVGTAGLLAVTVSAPQLLAPLYVEAAALAAYAAVCSAIMTIAARLLSGAGLVQSLGMFLVLANIFFGGVLLNLAEVSPHFARLQLLFPLYWYIEAIISHIH